MVVVLLLMLMMMVIVVMVTQTFRSSTMYLATSNSHVSGIVGPIHDHMAIPHRQAIDNQTNKQTIKQTNKQACDKLKAWWVVHCAAERVCGGTIS